MPSPLRSSAADRAPSGGLGLAATSCGAALIPARRLSRPLRSYCSSEGSPRSCRRPSARPASHTPRAQRGAGRRGAVQVAGGKRGGGDGEIGSNCDPPAPARCALRAHTRVRRLVLLRALAARRSSRIPGRGCAAMSRAPIAGSETDGPPSLFETSLAVLCRAVWAGDLRDLSERPLPEEALMRMFKVSAGAQNAARRSRSGAWRERWPRSQRAHRERARLCVARRWAVRQARALTRARTPCLRASWRAHTRALRPTNSCR